MRRLVASLAGLGLVLLAAAPVAGAQSPADLCAAAKAGTQCQPGNNRQTAGGGDKASHDGWPAISGVFWKVLDGEHLFVGGALSDELLGHHGSDVIRGGPGADFFTLTDVDCTLFHGLTHTFTVRARDVTGNLSEPSGPLTVTVP